MEGATVVVEGAIVVVEEATVVVEEATVVEPENIFFIGGFLNPMLGLWEFLICSLLILLSTGGVLGSPGQTLVTTPGCGGSNAATSEKNEQPHNKTAKNNEFATSGL